MSLAAAWRVGVAAQERRIARGCRGGEQPDRAREGQLQLGAELVHSRLGLTSGLRVRIALAAGRWRRCLGQRGEAVAVGAQHVGEQVGVTGVGLRTGTGVAAAQALSITWRDRRCAAAEASSSGSTSRPCWRFVAADPDSFWSLHREGEGLPMVFRDLPETDGSRTASSTRK